MQLLTLKEREQLAYSLRIKRSIPTTARLIGRHASVIRRELERNTLPGRRYDAAVAQRLADQRAKVTNHRKLDADEDLQRYVTDRLEQDWTPERIAGRLNAHPPPHLRGKHLCHETIYAWIYEGSGRYGGWYRTLVRKQPKRRRRCGRKPQKARIAERISVHERPEGKRAGDWESDTMVFSKQRGGLSVQYERSCQVARLHRLADRSAPVTAQAVTATLESVPRELVTSVTFDNGSENADHLAIRTAFDIPTYFCDPYASWQKGGVENLNGLIRRFLPRQIDFTAVSDGDLQTVEDWLNDLPRKSLGYRTPNEALAERIHQSVVH